MTTRLDPSLAASSPVALAAHAAQSRPALPPAAAPETFEYTTTRVVPAARKALQANLGVVRPDRSELTERFRMLRTQVMQRMATEGKRVIAVTSPRAIEGRSLAALNLALSIAAEFDSTALLVDAELGSQGLQRVFGLAGQPGLSDHLLHGTPLPSLLVNPAIERFVFLPAGAKPVGASAELLGTRAVRELVLEMRARYDDRIVVVDLPPVLETADALAFLPLVDTTLVVVEEHGTRMDDLQALAEVLAPFDLVGTVISRKAAQ